MNLEDVQGLTVSGKVLAAFFNLTDRRVRALEQDGIVTKTDRGKYVLIESVSRYITYLKANNATKEGCSISDSENYDLDYEKCLHERIKREQSELKLAAMNGSMHRAQDVERVMNDMLANFKSKLSNMPSKVAPMLVSRNEAVTIQNMLTTEINETLEELSQYDPINFYGKDYIDFEDEEEIPHAKKEAINKSEDS